MKLWFWLYVDRARNLRGALRFQERWRLLQLRNRIRVINRLVTSLRARAFFKRRVTGAGASVAAIIIVAWRAAATVCDGRAA